MARYLWYIARRRVLYGLGGVKCICWGQCLWTAKCPANGPLVPRYGARIMYDAASGADSKLRDYIRDGRWNFPTPTSQNLANVIQNLHRSYSDDQVVWAHSNNGEFTAASARNVIRTCGERVHWYGVVRLKGMYLD